MTTSTIDGSRKAPTNTTPFVATEIRSKRLAAGITVDLLARAAQVDRADLGRIERGLVLASPKRLQRIAAALDSLIRAKQEVDACAARVGWPAMVRESGSHCR